MALYFNIIIPFKRFVDELQVLINKYDIHLYVEKWNADKGFYYELIEYGQDFLFVSDQDYRTFFFSSKFVAVHEGKLSSGNKNNKIAVPKEKSFYDDNLSDYCIEGEGGREDDSNIEIIRLRIISKNPDKKIEKFYDAFQRLLKKNDELKRGLYLGNYFDDKVYFCETTKNKLADFSNKESQYRK